VGDEAEVLAIERAKALFGCEYANVQPHSGSQANQAVFMATLTPGDTFMGMDLAAGGHLTHGKSVNQSGKWFRPVSYAVRPQDHLIDYDQAAELALAEKPKVIIAGGSAYSRHIDFARFREIADSVGALLMADIAHYAGLVAGGVYPNPFPHAHVVTTTTHKTLRGPRGGLILTNDKKLAKKLDSAVFPGLQGGPLMHVIAAKAVAFGEALRPEFKAYARQVIDNARALADSLQEAGFRIVSNGTDSHLMLVDLTPKGVSGADAEIALERAGITTSKNLIPFDPLPPVQTSGIRVGTPAGTTRGFGEAEFRQVGRWIGEVLDGVAAGGDNSAVEARVRGEVLALTKRFPIYG
jgi:glycine hydroxymethyltransferase